MWIRPTKRCASVRHPPTHSYLSIPVLLEAARKAQAERLFILDTVFLSEECGLRRGLRRRTELCFIGPTPQQMRDFWFENMWRVGIAAENNVALLPGSELLADVPAAIEAAKCIGLPGDAEEYRWRRWDRDPFVPFW